MHEDAIIEYNETEDPKKREELYRELIEPAFGEMVDKIVYTFKFVNLPNIDDLKNECKTHLTTILDKYDDSKGSKAFSYYSVITRNWFFQKAKKNSKLLQKEVLVDDITQTADGEELGVLTVEHPYDNTREEAEFWENLWGEIEDWDKLELKDHEKRVLDAIKVLLANPDDIEIFNKKAIYMYIREMTNLNTKQVVNNLNKIRARYRDFKEKWDEGQI